MMFSFLHPNEGSSQTQLFYFKKEVIAFLHLDHKRSTTIELPDTTY